jgi:hypothetical protein
MPLACCCMRQQANKKPARLPERVFLWGISLNDAL